MIVYVGYVLLGFVLLMGGAEYTVKGAVAIANKLKIPEMIIGLTIVAFGTSAPEFVVSISAAFKGAAGIAVGNVVGSNIANILLILGGSAMIYPITCNRKVFLKDYSFLLGVSVVFVVFVSGGMIVAWQGWVMLALLLFFLWFNYNNSKLDCAEENERSPLADRGWFLVVIITLVGMAAIIYGADLLVDGAVEIARIFGVSEEIIGLTLIAFGTSLPELATSGMAAFRHQNGVALGNIIGSNIWNIVFIMGATATMVDVPVSEQFRGYDIWVMLGVTVLLLPIMYSKSKISRKEGFLFFLLYLAYLGSQIVMNK